MRKHRVVDLASKISKKHKKIGLRAGEKMEEILLSEREKKIVEEKKNMWIIHYN